MNALLNFLVLFRIFSLRGMRNAPFRAMGVVAGIAVGAAVFTGVRLSIHTCLDSLTLGMDRLAGKTEAIARAPGGRLPEELAAALFSHPLVETASPVMTTHVLAEGARAPFLLLGIDPLLDRPLRDWGMTRESRTTFSSMTLTAVPATVVVGARLLEETGLSAGEALVLSRGAVVSRFHIAGSLGARGPADGRGSRIAVCDIASFQEFTGVVGEVDRIDLRFYGGPRKETLDTVSALLPEGARLTTPEREISGGKEMVRAYGLNLTVLSFVSLFVGMFLVYSIVSMNMAARRRELAVMRSLGASAPVCFSLFLGEGAFFGAAGWIASLPLGGYLVKHLLSGVSRTVSNLFTPIAVDALSVSGWEIFGSFCLTMTVSLLAAWHPARRAGAVPPVEAMAVTPRGRASVGSFPWAPMGVACIALVWPVTRIPAVSGVPLSGYVGTFMLFAGFSLLSGRLLDTWSRFFPLPGGIGGIEADLAGRYARKGGTSTTVAVGALITAMGLFFALVIMVHSFRGAVTDWVHRTLGGDLFIRPSLAGENRYRDPIPRSIADKLAEMSPLMEMVPYDRFYTRYAGAPYVFEAMDLGAFLGHGRFSWTGGGGAAGLEAARKGEGVIVSEVFAGRSGLGVGETFSAVIGGRKVQLPVVGIIRDYRTSGGVVFSDYRALGKGAEKRWGGVRFYVRDGVSDPPGAVADLHGALERAFPGKLDIISGAELRGAVMEMFNETFSLTFVLLVVALFTAGIGIAVSLAVQVLERSAELNTIIAVGGSRAQVRAVILWETLIIACAGVFGGLVCGFALSWILIHVINRGSFGWTFPMRVNWPMIAGSIPLVLVTGILAAMPAVSLVFRQNPADLLRQR